MARVHDRTLSDCLPSQPCCRVATAAGWDDPTRVSSNTPFPRAALLRIPRCRAARPSLKHRVSGREHGVGRAVRFQRRRRHGPRDSVIRRARRWQPCCTVESSGPPPDDCHPCRCNLLFAISCPGRRWIVISICHLISSTTRTTDVLQPEVPSSCRDEQTVHPTRASLRLQAVRPHTMRPASNDDERRRYRQTQHAIDRVRGRTSDDAAHPMRSRWPTALRESVSARRLPCAHWEWGEDRSRVHPAASRLEVRVECGSRYLPRRGRHSAGSPT